MELSNNEEEKKLNSKINIRSLNLQLENQISYGEELKSGLSEFNFLKSKSIANIKLAKIILNSNYLIKLKNQNFLIMEN
jgi:hypothetical protein